MLQRWRAADTSHVFFHSSALRVFDRVDLSPLNDRYWCEVAIFHSHWCQIFTSPLQRCVSNVSHTQQDDGSAFVCVQMFLTASPSTRSTRQTHNSSSVRSAWCWGMCEHIASSELINWITPLTGRVLNNPGIPECYIYLLDYTQIKRKVV